MDSGEGVLEERSDGTFSGCYFREYDSRNDRQRRAPHMERFDTMQPRWRRCLAGILR
ncbi:uncharacterized protein MYCGRDRAFT_84891 [Zymoseptoria tritici IPO323]|uniref:Uncharacterized protein n=1 Tax=Zymoseptoria tritici (strain CBS 115943 / IPO323) TaxID=336722 RepID=F9X4Q6_ZYMTI|nr:uncharacterized protein MYCGRDRAFT_84891 [Zymoseptoria tritici IPO323]EGP90263.1 hypothetical protein MYCGRDRAFT_84891 [Zymoseptoria tritici IPO323]